MSDVSRLLDAVGAGDLLAANELLPVVYDELRCLAAQKLAREEPGHTLDATALVHEAYLRLVGEQKFEHRVHFFAAAAKAMRRILVESARRRNAEKRGGGREREAVEPDQLAAPTRDDELLALDEALTRLAQKDALKADLVTLRYFAGLTADEAASVLGIAPSTADRHWAYARAWLHRAIRGGQ